MLDLKSYGRYQSKVEWTGKFLEITDWIDEHCGEDAVISSIRVISHNDRRIDSLTVDFKNPKHQTLFELAWSEYVIRS